MRPIRIPLPQIRPSQLNELPKGGRLDNRKRRHSTRHRTITDGTKGSIVPNGVLGWDGEDFPTEPSCELIPGVGCDGEVWVGDVEVAV